MSTFLVPRKRNDLPELMPKEVGTKQQVPRILWKLVHYWACFAAFLTPRYDREANLHKLYILKLWHTQLIMRIKNCLQALAEEGIPRPAKMLVGKPLWQISWYSADVLAEDVERTTHLWMLVPGLICQRTCPLMMMKSIPGLQTLTTWFFKIPMLIT